MRNSGDDGAIIIETDIDTETVRGLLAVCYAPPKVQVLAIGSLGRRSELTGSVDLTQLLTELKILRLNNNRFTGEIDLTHLPGGMRLLSLRSNQLSGPLVIMRVPARMISMDWRSNYFQAIAVVHSETRAVIKLKGSGVMSIVDENGKEADTKRFLR